MPITALDSTPSVQGKATDAESGGCMEIVTPVVVVEPEREIRLWGMVFDRAERCRFFPFVPQSFPGDQKAKEQSRRIALSA